MVYNPTLYLTLNNYGYNNESIAKAKEYLRTRKLPDSLDNSGKKKRFLAKWEKDFKIENDKLVYSPLNLIVVPDGERDMVLKKIYEDITQGPAQGIDLFYARVRDKYLNIRRSDVATFLKSQKLYQITKSQNHTINKPIMSSSPNERWGIDCINMVSYASANGGIDRGWKFILTVVDYFSRKVWLRALKSQTAINVRNALINIHAETKTWARIVQADRGSEFLGEISELFKQHNVKYIKTLSYSPESNGLVEGTNKKIRRVLREIMIRENSRNWYSHLQTTANLLNSQRNGTTKQTPDSVWKEGHELQGEQDESIIRLHERRIINAIKNNDTTEYKLGDFVRVKMGTLYSKVRKLI
jgi:IS30 family transposase